MNAFLCAHYVGLGILLSFVLFARSLWSNKVTGIILKAQKIFLLMKSKVQNCTVIEIDVIASWVVKVHWKSMKRLSIVIDMFFFWSG